MRCLLLQAGEGWEELVELHALPVGTLPEDVLQQGQLYQASIAGGSGGRLYWQHSPLAWQHNLLASGLANTQVCGDAVLALPEPASELQLHQQVQQLAAQHLRHSAGWRLSGAGPCGAIGGIDPSCAPGRRKRSVGSQQQQQALLQQLLRRPVRASAQQRPGVAADAQAGAQEWGEAAVAAPGTPERQPVLAATTAAAGVQQPGPEPENPQPQQAGLRAARQHPPQQQASHEVQIFECEPRQQLLWSIAGRATSMSWQGGAAAAGAPAAGAGPAGLSPAVAVPAVAVQPATCDSLPAAAPAAAEAVLGLPSDAAPAVLPVKYRGSLERSCWTELQPEMLAVVLAQAGHSSHTARTLSQVCSSWRQGVAAERSALRQLRFSRLEPRAAGSCGNGSSQASSALSGAGAERSSSSGGFQLPWLVEQAVKAGNVAASVAAARYLERQGQDGVLPQSTPGSAAALRAAGTWYGAESEAAALRRGAGAAAARSSGMAAQAARYWARAAKAGHPEAQWKLGLGHYKGLMGLSHDSEEALMWLSRAARQLEEAAAKPGGGAGSSDCRGAAGTPPNTVQPRLPVLMTQASCRQTLAQAAHILGYLCLDGEGTRADTQAAIRWFRLAERYGCLEAGRVLGSLYNSGQY